MSKPYPRGVAHVGVTVPEIEEPIDWYESVLGFDLLRTHQEVEHGEEHIGKLCADVLGEFKSVRIAHVATGSPSSSSSSPRPARTNPIPRRRATSTSA